MTADKVVFAPVGVNVPDRASVAPALCDDSEAKRILLDVMGVKAIDDGVWESVLRESLTTVSNDPFEAHYSGWRAFWTKLRAAPESVRQRFVAYNRSRIRVRRRDGHWVLADAVLLPGELISSDDTSSNQNVLIDSAMHGNDGALLTALEVVEFPKDTNEAVSDRYGSREWHDVYGLCEWHDDCGRTYENTHHNSASLNYLEPVGLKMPKGWGFLATLSGTPNAKLTDRFLARIGQNEFVDKLPFGHRTVSSYPKIYVPHPLPWFLLKCGTVLVGDATVRLAAIVARRRNPALARIDNWERLQPALARLEPTFPPNPVSVANIRDLWLASSRRLPLHSRSLTTHCVIFGVVPRTMKSFPTRFAQSGEVPLSDVFVTGSPDLARRARRPDRMVVTLDDDARKLWLSKGARNLSELIAPAWATVSGPADLLVSVVPELADVLRSDALNTARCQPVSELKLNIVDACEPIPCLMWENALFFDAEQLGRFSRAERLKVLINEVAAAGWLNYEPADALRRIGDARVDERRAKIASGASLAERLLLAVGGRDEPLRQALGGLAGADFVRQCTPLQLAELTLAQLGPAALAAFKEALEAEGLRPPSRWNTAEARSFVASIGFPQEFAASPEPRREPEEDISGPIELPPLHDFQEEVLEGIRELLARGTTRRRAVVCLPTGAGKTRVTVEAAVLFVLKPEWDHRSVLWVAQTDELCEQAVQAFRQVWLNLGAQRTDLRIVRLWDRNPNPAAEEPDRPVVVVASIQTLNSRMGTEGLAWLQKPGLVVVDECHHAITPSYTNLLRWLDAEALRPGVPENEEPPIIGLSATPFRTDDEESQRLAKRFDNRWFPANQEQLVSRLRSQGVLAEPEDESLPSGSDLLEEEIEQLSQLPEPWEGLDFENLLEAINQRLASDEQRNLRLLERISAMWRTFDTILCQFRVARKRNVGTAEPRRNFRRRHQWQHADCGAPLFP